jgi:hypothetical protein
MLKIKDNVDLKELEKFGFVKDKVLGRYFKRGSQYGQWIKLLLEVVDRKIIACGKNVDYEKETDDLIKADLVEEVSNE